MGRPWERSSFPRRQLPGWAVCARLIIALVMVHSFGGVRVAAEQSPQTDSIEAAILKNFSLAYNLQNAANPDVDPCSWNSNHITCDCYFENYTVCRAVQLDFSETGMVGPFPTELTNLTSLYSLALYNNNLTGAIPPEIGLLTSLTSLSLGTNFLSGPIPPEIGNLQSLGLLHLDSNQLSGSIPTKIGNISTLNILWLSDNNLSGPIPDIFGNFTKLQDVRIQGNPSLQGPIPSSLFSIPSIETIYIGELAPGGALPTTFNTQLVNLSTLYLRNCQLTGSIPSSISNFSALQYLDLSFNNLSGQIPPELLEITTLKTLYLGNNSLTGPLPEGLGNLTSLTDVDVSYNSLNGTLPSWADTTTPIVVFNNFTTTTAANASLQSQLSLFNCKNQLEAPCIPSTPGQVTRWAVRAGGEADGTYQADIAALGTTGFYTSASMEWAVSSTSFPAGGSFQTVVNSTTPVSGTADPTLYMTARQSLGSLRYYVTQLQNGAYTVVLSFAEILFTRENNLARRFFNIYLQGELVKRDFNIRETAGGSYIAHQETFNATVSNGVLEIHLFYAGKGTCCLPPSYNWSFGPLISALSVENVLYTEQQKSKRGASAGLIGGVVAAAVVVASVCLLYRLAIIRRRNRTTLRLEDQLEITRFQVQPNLFSYAELKAATRSFHPDNKLGEGGYGVVYKGVLADGTAVAVKTLSAKSSQGKQEFLNEAALITAVQHRSLVKLKGCCLERDHRILVYEFLENKSLHQALFGGTVPMDWPTRFNIAVGTARGLAYLHEESEARIIHRDIKASNILLDGNCNPKIADFGMARLFKEHQTHVSTRVAGTLGYLAPEYALRGKLTEKADVFSFGIVLLEIVSGRFNIRSDILGEQAYLLEWAWKLLGEDKLLYLLDPKLLDSYNEEEVLRVVEVAILCTQVAASTRPSMTRVVAMLVGDIDIPPVTSGPGFMTSLLDSDAPSTTTSLNTTSSTSSSHVSRGKSESAPLIQLNEVHLSCEEIFTEMVSTGLDRSGFSM